MAIESGLLVLTTTNTSLSVMPAHKREHTNAARTTGPSTWRYCFLLIYSVGSLARSSLFHQRVATLAVRRRKFKSHGENSLQSGASWHCHRCKVGYPQPMGSLHRVGWGQPTLQPPSVFRRW